MKPLFPVQDHPSVWWTILFPPPSRYPCRFLPYFLVSRDWYRLVSIGEYVVVCSVSFKLKSVFFKDSFQVFSFQNFVFTPFSIAIIRLAYVFVKCSFIKLNHPHLYPSSLGLTPKSHQNHHLFFNSPILFMVFVPNVGY